ncbi:MAG: diacylglycerol kinase family lipid kinase [Firmicutes bacterium]|nr:diacylglycerol kinase family lipid kinase [Bacillota bacterium]
MIHTRTLYIVNPVAGRGRSLRVWRELEAKLKEKGLPPDHRMTPGPLTVTGITEESVRRGYDRIVAVGGDGTVREIVSALVGSNVELGIVPAGTGNDFARTFGLPKTVDEVIPLLAGNHWTAADVGRVNGNYFVNIAGCGIDADIAEAVNRSRVIVNGTVTYLLTAVKTVLGYASAFMRISIDGKIIEGRVLVLAVANGKFYGGGIMMAPDARVDDGKFHVIVARDVSRSEALRLLPLTYSGRHILNRKVHVYTGSEVSVEADRPLAIQADGTLVGNVPTTFSLLPGALRVLAPPGDGR